MAAYIMVHRLDDADTRGSSMRRQQATPRQTAIGCGALLLICGGLWYVFNSSGENGADVATPTTAVVTDVAATEALATIVEATNTAEVHPTDTAAASPEPPTEAPAPTTPPSEEPLPTTPPTEAQPPTEPPPPRPDYPDPGADRDCKDFTSGAEAQAWWNYWHAQGHPNPGHLDGDGDGHVCESY